MCLCMMHLHKADTLILPIYNIGNKIRDIISSGGGKKAPEKGAWGEGE